MVKLSVYSGLHVHAFVTTPENIKNLYLLYYGWPVNSPHRKLTKPPINLTGEVVLNGFKRNYKELLKTIAKEKFIAKINGCTCKKRFILK